MGSLGQMIDFMKHLFYDLFVAVSSCVALVKVIAIEWKDLKRYFRK